MNHIERSWTDTGFLLELRESIGGKLIAYIAGSKRVVVIHEWIEGRHAPAPEVEVRLRFAHQVVRLMQPRVRGGAIRRWLVEPNTGLSGASPVTLIRDGDLKAEGPRIIGAARAHIGA